MSDIREYINIIFLSNDWNEYHRKAFTEQLVRKLNLWSNVVLVQLPVSILVHLFTSFRKKIIGLVSGKYKTIEIANNSYLFTPVMVFHYLLWNKCKIFFKIDFWLLNRQLNKFINKKFDSQKKIIWYYFPYFIDFILKYDANLKIYDQYDIYHMDISGKVDEKKKKMNDKMIKNSDIVLCTAQYLFDFSKNLNDNTYYITNGSNYELLSAPKNKARIELPIRDGKTIGYLGGLRNWIDFELMNYIVSKLPEVNFLFIGPVYTTAKLEMKNIRKFKNVLWVDFIQPEYLPSFIANFDAGIIPFKITEFFKSVFPNKFFEYLASGLPVITTNLPELKKYENIIGYSYGKSDFLENCKKALNGHFDKNKEDYLEISKENSWRVKAKEMSDKIEKIILKNNLLYEQNKKTY